MWGDLSTILLEPIWFYKCEVDMASRGRSVKRRFGENGFEDGGGYMAVKKSKLEEQYSDATKKQISSPEQLKKGIFAGVAIFVNGYTG